MNWSLISPSMNWSLINFHVVVIDEIFMISLCNSDHVFECFHSLPVFPLLIFCGDKFQLQPFETTDESSQLLPSFLKIPFFLETHPIFFSPNNIAAPTLLLTHSYALSDTLMSPTEISSNVCLHYLSLITLNRLEQKS